MLAHVLVMFACLCPAASPTATSSPSEAFAYKRPARLETREAPAQKVSVPPGAHQREIIFKNAGGHDVTVLITTPAQGNGPFRTVVLLHGFGGNKEEVTTHAGTPLLKAGFACIALDLPFHGQRGNAPNDFFTADYEKSYRNTVEAITDIRQTIDLAAAQKDLDTSKGVALVGFSMGTWLGSLAAAADSRVHAMVLMSGGSAILLPGPASRPTSAITASQQNTVEIRNALIRAYPVLRHDGALDRFAPRPLLLQNGRRDEVATAQKVQAFYDAAGQPKTLRWYDSGHGLPGAAYRDAAAWLQKNWAGADSEKVDK